MKNLNDILNSDLLNSIIEQENKDLEEAGWNYEEIRIFAESLVNQIEKK